MIFGNDLDDFIDIRCENWRRCFISHARRNSSSLAKVIAALKIKAGIIDGNRENISQASLDRADAELLERVWTELNQREKHIIFVGIFLKHAPLGLICRQLNMSKREFNTNFRRSIVLFREQVLKHDV